MPTSVKAIKYRVCGLNDDDPDSNAWSLTVEWRGPGDSWAVKHHAYCLSSNGDWDPEPTPSERTEQWRATHRFTKHMAMALALERYPNLINNGLWVRDDDLGIGHLVPADVQAPAQA
jgi:hypothetical protein